MVQATSTKVLNVKTLSIISNSSAEFCIYTYKATTESTEDIKRAGFFNPGYSVFKVGDALRVMHYVNNVLTKYYEFVIMSVDTDNKTVSAAIVHEVNLTSKIVGAGDTSKT